MPLIQYRYGNGNRARLTTPEGERVLVHGEDMVLPMPGKETRDIPASTPVFVGHGVSEPERGWDDYAGVDVRGRLVFLLEGDFAALPSELQAEYDDPRVGPMRLVQAALDHEAAGVVIIPPAGTFEYWGALVATRMTGTFAAARPYSITAPED